MHARDASVIRLLLEKGADINQQDNDGGYALLHVVGEGIHYGSLDAIYQLLENGADPQLMADNGTSAFSIISKEEQVRVLLLSVF